MTDSMQLHKQQHGMLSPLRPGSRQDRQPQPPQACAGADCTLQAFSLRQGLAQAWRVQLPDFPYSLAAGSSSLGESPGVAICGCGDGSLIAVDADRGSVAWSLSGNAAAVRAVIAGQGSMFAAGDDGQVASWAWQ